MSTDTKSTCRKRRSYSNELPRPARARTGIVKWALRLPRLMMSGPPPKEPNGGVPLITCGVDVWVTATFPTTITDKSTNQNERVIFLSLSAYWMAKSCRDRPVLKKALLTSMSTDKVPCQYL